jgi:hypothetical protein
MIDIFWWWSFAVYYKLRELYHDMPGPAPVKIILVIAAIAEPGPFAELSLATLLFASRRIRKWRKRSK